MAETLTELVAKINVDASGLKKGLADAEKQSEYSSKQIQDSLNKVSKSMAIAGAAITAAMGLVTKAAEDERVNIARLSAMLKNVGVSYDEVSEALERNIKATQRKTGVADNEQRDVLGRLVLVTKDYNEALSLLPLVLDLAAAGQMDVTTAATYLGKGMEELAAGAETITIRLGQASMQFKSLEEIQQAVGGSAEATANQFSILQAELGDMQEQIGAQLLPILNNVVENIIPIVENIGRWAEENPVLVESIAKFGVALIAAAAALKGVALLLAIVNALQGPKGWINLAVAVGVTAGAYFGLDQLLKDTNQGLDEGSKKAAEAIPGFNGLAQSINGVTTAVDGASASYSTMGKIATSTLDKAIGGITTLVDNIREALHKAQNEELAYMNMLEFNARATALNIRKIFSQSQMDTLSKLDMAIRNKWSPEDINRLMNEYYGTDIPFPGEIPGPYIDPQSVLQGPGPAPGSAEYSAAHSGGEGFMGYVPGEGPVWAEGYANGGIVPGSIGSPRLAVVHGGEEITPAYARESPSISINVQGSVITERELGDIVWKYLLKKNKTNYTTGLS